MGDFTEVDVRSVLQDKRHAAPPCLHHLNTAQEIGDERITAFGNISVQHFFNGHIVIQATGAADFDTIFENSNLHIIRVTVVAMTEGVDDGT